MPEIRDLAFALMQAQAKNVQLEKEQLKYKIKKTKEKLPEMWAEVY